MFYFKYYLICCLIILIITIVFVEIAATKNVSKNKKLSKKYVKYTQVPKPETYPFTCSNPNYIILKQINLWYKNQSTIIRKNPLEWPGEEGNGVAIPEHLKDEENKRFKENHFNIVASDLIALNRSIPDKRTKE